MTIRTRNESAGALSAFRRLILVLGAALLAMAPAAASAASLPPIHHVYVIVLENESVATTFGANSLAPYLSDTLRSQGAYVPRYYGIGHFSADNYIAMISGQAPNHDSELDCQTFSDFAGTSIGAMGQVQGSGCVYPSGVPTIASQLQGAGLSWRDYNDGMGADPSRESSVCGHPPVGGHDNTQHATAQDQYATRHNPFVYFHSIIDNTTLCDSHVVSLDPLTQNLRNVNPPNYVFITPNLCNDGHDATCASGGPGGLGAADSFLRKWVPQITGSTAYRRDGGLLVIAFDEAGVPADSSACCGEIPGPGSATPGLSGPGGGDTGAVLLSPYIKAGTVTQQAYNHYSLLRSVEDLFGLGHIGYAQLPGARSLGSDVFACAPAVSPRPVHRRLPGGSEVRSVRINRHGKQRALTLYSVGASTLQLTLSGPHRHRVKVIRTLSPCQSYTLRLPSGSGWSVALSAAIPSGAQTAGLRY